MSKVSANGCSLGVRTLTTAGLVTVVAALVLGILGMHGLSQHGAATHAAAPVPAVTVDPHANHPSPDHHPVTPETSAGAVASTAVAEAGFGSTDDGHESTGEMVMLCVAMLLAAASAVLLALRLVRFAHRAPLSFMPRIRIPSFPATSRAGTGPPAVWEFSVVRC